ncbi:MAG TPA: carboxypeptidase-like regulatory domain-containing protein [Thermoleophilaceae bacterium]|nr:carboxypeptidase-like regulatory domain-containing protein [Thermoleophilaceae bacterium]
MSSGECDLSRSDRRRTKDLPDWASSSGRSWNPFARLSTAADTNACHPIHGTVLASDGKPVGGVAVLAVGPQTAKDTTNRDGSYSMKVRPGTYTVKGGAAAVPLIPKTHTVKVTKDSGARADFKVGDSVINGRVTTRSGDGVEDVTVKARKGKDQRGFAGVTNKTGAFRIEIPASQAGQYEFKPSKTDANTRLSPTLRKRSFTPATRSVAVRIAQPATVKFEIVPVLTGVVLASDNRPLAKVDVAIRSQAVSRHVQTDKDGRYQVAVPPNTYLVTPSFGGDSVPFKPAAGAGCRPSGHSCSVHLDRDLAANFRSVCERTVDFKSSMIAVGGCFLRVAKERWEVTGHYRINGVDFETRDPDEPTVFDGKARRVSGKKLRVWMSEAGNERRWLAYDIAAFNHSFPGTSVRYTLALGNLSKTRGVGGPALETASATLFGMPAHAPGMELESTAGRTTITMQLSSPPEDGATIDPFAGTWKGKNGRIAYTNILRATIALTNDHGLQTIEGSIAPKSIYGFGPRNAKGFPAAGFIQLARVAVKYDFAFDIWTFSGIAVLHAGSPTTQLAGRAGTLFADSEGNVFLSAKILDLAVGLKFSAAEGESYIQRLRLAANGLNWLFAPAWQLYVQRAGFDFGRDTDAPGAPLKAQLLAGFTWLPRFRNDFWFQEVASLDLDAGFFSDPEDSWRGGAILRVAGARILTGQAKWFPASGNVEVSGRMTFNARELLRVALPVSFDGQATLRFPHNQYPELTGVGRAALFGSELEANLLVRFDPGIGVFAVCLGKGSRFGFTWDADGRHYGGCDVGDFVRRRQPPVGRASVATTRTVDLPAGTSIEAIAVRGSGGPPRVRLEGPGGLTLSVPDGREASISQAHSMIRNADDATTYIFLSRPPGGTYRIVPLAGSPRISAVAVAGPAAPPKVNARVATSGCRRTLSWTLKPRPGQRVRFVERSKQGEHEIAVTSTAKGSVTFTPTVGAHGSRTILAKVEQNGTPRATIRVAKYRADTGTPPSRVTGLKASGGRKLTVHWKPVCGARSYLVKVRRGKHAVQQVTRSTRTTIASPSGSGQRVVSVAAIGYRGDVGPARRVVLPG